MSDTRLHGKGITREERYQLACRLVDLLNEEFGDPSTWPAQPSDTWSLFTVSARPSAIACCGSSDWHIEAVMAGGSRFWFAGKVHPNIGYILVPELTTSDFAEAVRFCVDRDTEEILAPVADKLLG